MMKLTDKDYQLYTIEAFASNGLLEGGTTQPLSIRGVNMTTGDRDHNYILKWRSSTRLSVDNMTNELIGAWIALELDIVCVEPFLINISDQFVEKVMTDQPGYKFAQQSIGINFGSKYMEGLFPFINQYNPKNIDQVQQAMMIFVFDMFVDNGDRGQGKMNLFWRDDRYVVLDHEMIFSFLHLLLGQNPYPWLIEKDVDLYKKHPLLPFLKNSTPDINACVEKLTLINDHFWNCVDQWLPAECKSEKIEKIKSRLNSVIANRDIFVEQLYKILAS